MTRNLIARFVMCTVWLGLSVTMLAQSGSFTYDPAAEATVTGTIVAVVSLPAQSGVGVHFDFRTADGMLNVHVAPALFIGMNNASYFAEDQLTLVGVKAFIDGNRSFIVRSITKDGQTLTLRAADGKPAWSPAVEGADGCGVAHPVLPRGTEM